MAEKKFLLLGGKPIGSMDILNYARGQGYHITVCDYLPAEESPCKQVADECWALSTADVDAIVAKARECGINAVFTGVHEFNIASCAEICEKLQLPCYVTPEIWEKTSNKQYYKSVWAANGIEVIPEFCIDAGDPADDIEYPILLKPVDGSGARGIAICRSADEVKAKISMTLAGSSSGVFIAEKYIEEKDEITIVYMVRNGVSVLAALADRVVLNFDEQHIPLPAGYIWPSRYLELYRRVCDEKMKKSLSDMDITNGMVFIQAIVRDEHIYPYDMGYRISGTQEHIIFENICGFNPLKMLTDYALGRGFGDDEMLSHLNPDFPGYAAQITFLGMPGVIGQFCGVEEVEKMPGVLRVIKNHPEGEEIPPEAVGTLNQILLRVFMYAPERERFFELLSNIRTRVNVLSIDSCSMVIPASAEIYRAYGK